MTVKATILKGNKVRLVFNTKLSNDNFSLISGTMNLIAHANKGESTIMLTDKNSFDKLVENEILTVN